MSAAKERTIVMPRENEHFRLGYIVNVTLSDGACRAIAPLQDVLDQEFPKVMWRARPGEAHITVLDLLTPGTDYGKDKDDLYAEVGPEYEHILADIIKQQQPVTITFDRAEAYASAVVVRGHDNGSLQRIREQFNERANLLPNTKKQTPSFVHATICRFAGETNLAAVQDVVSRTPIQLEERLDELWIARETKLFMQRYDVMRRFRLGVPVA